MFIMMNAICYLNAKVNASVLLNNLEHAKNISINLVVNKIVKTNGNVINMNLMLSNSNKYSNLIHYNKHFIITNNYQILEI